MFLASKSLERLSWSECRKRSAPPYIIEFDSCSSMLYGLGGCLSGKDFPAVRIAGKWPSLLAPLFHSLPERGREFVYSWGGWFEASPSRTLASVNSEEISNWVARQYPPGPYPAIMVGSSNGAAVHLCAALGIPWLPQTFLSAVRRFLDVDDLKGDLAWGRLPARAILNKNPDLQIHQMKDPLQDRLMVARMGYFRMKKRKLGEGYKSFIRQRLRRNGVLITLECRYLWPQVRVGERHFFQTGGLGGMEPEEYIDGGARVRAFLREKSSRVSQWDAPAPDYQGPEAEWGFEDSLLEDTRRFAAENGYRLWRIVFYHPEMLSSWVSEIYRWWYLRRSLPVSRLLVESFAFLEPLWALRTASIPFWMAFNTEGSYRFLERYLSELEKPFQEIYMVLMANGVRGVGVVPISEWQALMSREAAKGTFLGNDPRKYPSDFGVFITYHKEFKRVITERYLPPVKMTLEEMLEFFEKYKSAYPVEVHAAEVKG